MSRVFDDNSETARATMSNRPHVSAMIERLYADAKGQWWGCNWKSEDGPQKLNLCDMRSLQANLMAEATSGEEAAAWEQATLYLKLVEADAQTAERHAEKAVSLVLAGDFARALDEMNAAVTLESQYRDCIVWKRMRDEIAALVESMPDSF